MDVCRGELLAQQVSGFSPLSVSESLAIQHRIFSDGPATREEVETLFGLCSSFEKTDQAWKRAFVETVTNHLLGQGAEYGFLEFDAEDWLIQIVDTEDMLSNFLRFELLQSVLQNAQNASTRLAQFALASTLKCVDRAEIDQNFGTDKAAQQA